jgi:hypothetical protein
VTVNTRSGTWLHRQWFLSRLHLLHSRILVHTQVHSQTESPNKRQPQQLTESPKWHLSHQNCIGVIKRQPRHQILSKKSTPSEPSESSNDIQVTACVTSGIPIIKQHLSLEHHPSHQFCCHDCTVKRSLSPDYSNRLLQLVAGCCSSLLSLLDVGYYWPSLPYHMTCCGPSLPDSPFAAGCFVAS